MSTSWSDNTLSEQEYATAPDTPDLDFEELFLENHRRIAQTIPLLLNFPQVTFSPPTPPSPLERDFNVDQDLELHPLPVREGALYMTAADGVGAASVSSEDERRNFYSRVTSRMGDQQGPLIIVGAIVGIVALLVLILLPLSFSGVEYYEFGFIRRKTTGAVDTNKVYTTGLHAIGPDYEFKKFHADAHFERFSTGVFAADRLQVTVTCAFQYFLRKDELQALHKKYDLGYQPILRSNAMDALKGAATQFSTREYIRDRKLVEDHIFKAVKERLGGECCNIGCEKTGTCGPGCKLYKHCNESTQQGLHAEVRYFQLTMVDIPDELNQRYLQALILQEDTETEKLKQQGHVIRKETEAKVKQIENEAAEISQNGTALSALIVSKANANARSIVEAARSEGLLHLYSRLGISDPKHRTSLDYLRSLRGKEGVSLAVGYDTLVAGPMQETHNG